MVISYSFKGFEVFQKVPGIIIVEICEKCVTTHIYIYINLDAGEGGEYMSWLPYMFHLLFIKTKKLQEHDLS